jgi:hypothetical protein
VKDIRYLVRLLFGAGVLLFGMQAIAMGQTDLTGYWKLSVPDGGIRCLELEQNGEAITSVSLRGPRGALSGTLRDGKLHLQGLPGPDGRKST